MPKTALIVEDEIFVALDLERILVDAGYNVVGIAADRETALACSHLCDVAFVDVNLRDGATGPEIGRLMSNDGVKVVFVTANPSQIGCVDGALGYIRKPFSDAAILAATVAAEGGMPPAGGALMPLSAMGTG